MAARIINKTPVRKERKFWISTPQVTGQVNVNGFGRISQTPPVWKVFIGQPLLNLTTWLKKQGVVDIEEL